MNTNQINGGSSEKVFLDADGPISAADQRSPIVGTDSDAKQFAAIVSHDLESSLLVLAKNAEMLREVGPHLSLEQENHLAGIERTTRRMKRLLTGMRKLAASSVELEPVALEAVVEEAAETLAPLAAEASAEVALSTPMPMVIGDRNQLVELFQNLVANAIKYGPARGGRVTIGAARSPGAWSVSVTDQGPGIAPEDRNRIFEPYQRLSGASHRPGTGLGLAICRRIAENHGGALFVQPARGGGSTFVVTLPDRLVEAPSPNDAALGSA